MADVAATGTRIFGAIAFVFLATSNKSIWSLFKRVQFRTPAPPTNAILPPVPDGSTRAPSATPPPDGLILAPSVALAPITGGHTPAPAGTLLQGQSVPLPPIKVGEHARAPSATVPPAGSTRAPSATRQPDDAPPSAATTVRPDGSFRVPSATLQPDGSFLAPSKISPPTRRNPAPGAMDGETRACTSSPIFPPVLPPVPTSSPVEASLPTLLPPTTAVVDPPIAPSVAVGTRPSALPSAGIRRHFEPSDPSPTSSAHNALSPDPDDAPPSAATTLRPDGSFRGPSATLQPDGSFLAPSKKSRPSRRNPAPGAMDGETRAYTRSPIPPPTLNPGTTLAPVEASSPTWTSPTTVRPDGSFRGPSATLQPDGSFLAPSKKTPPTRRIPAPGIHPDPTTPLPVGASSPTLPPPTTAVVGPPIAPPVPTCPRPCALPSAGIRGHFEPSDPSPTSSAHNTIPPVLAPAMVRPLPPASSGNTDDGGPSSSSSNNVELLLTIATSGMGLMGVFSMARYLYNLRVSMRPRSSGAGATAINGSPSPQDWQQRVVLEDGRDADNHIQVAAGTSDTNMLHTVHPSTAWTDLEKASTVHLGSKAGNDGSRQEGVLSWVLGNAPPSNASLSVREKTDATLSRAADTVPDESKSGGDSAEDVGSREAAGNLGVAQAVAEAAEQLAQYSAVPGVSEAATFVVLLVNLLSDSRGNAKAIEASMKRCRYFVYMLQRAAKVLEKGEGVTDEAERVAIEDVRDAVADLVALIKTYQSKNKVVQVLWSTLFKRRQEEAEAVIDKAISRLHFGLSVQAGQDVKEGLRRQSRAPEQNEALVEARRKRRQRRMFQMEIPKEEVTITDELLGTGGFGSVYLCDYNGWNVAAKVLQVRLDFIGDLDDDEQHVSGLSPAALERLRKQKKDFLRELDAMNRLRSPYTVNLYGAVTSYEGRLILIMELLAGGDLRTFLKNRADEPLPEDEVRRIIGDVCAGMSFLHTKQTVHGDLKSANILLDGAGRAKLGDFGTARWTRHVSSTDLATYTAQATLHSTPHSFGWTAPEVLNAKGKSYASDVYSFGVVVWEVLSRKVPWAEEDLSLKDIHIRVVLNGHRLVIPANTPADIREVITSCWRAGPASRPTFEKIAADLVRKA